jgi:hypothetical protein
MREEVEKNYPRTTKTFRDSQKTMYALFLKKQYDYGPSNIGLGKDKIETDEDVRKSLMGIAIRMNDKVSRLVNLTMNNKQPNNESLIDTLLDIANYAVMALIVIRKEWGK